MVSELLDTKLYIPGLKRQFVLRERLLNRLDKAMSSKLTLVSAPPGFGKTTLLANWLFIANPDSACVAWLALDPQDNQPLTFWRYVLAALQTVAPKVGADARALLEGAQPPPTEIILTSLINDVAELSSETVLVLDDYHLIEDREVHEGMAFLLDHLPQRLHLVIASRTDPPLPLARMRARGELVELRAAELRFQPDEASAYINEKMSLGLAPSQLAVLEDRTEGWIAALQLAALSMQGQSDNDEFIAGFAGDDRYIVDYLVEEVLQRQTAEVRAFLLKTSILERMCGPLCDAVTGQEGGQAMLEALERANVFVVPLDNQRRWYRYHHLFADVLRAHARDGVPESAHDLNRLACLWYEANGYRLDAIRHALAAHDSPLAADLIQLAIPALRQNRQEATLLAWLKALPSDTIHARPLLSVDYAGVLLSSGELEGVESLLRSAERSLNTVARIGRGAADSDTASDEDKAAFRGLPGWIAIYRAGQAQARGDAAETVKHAQEALELLPEDDDLGHGAASALVGLAAWGDGDLETAYRLYAESMTRFRRIGHIADTFGLAIVMADIRMTQGRLRDAMSSYEETLSFAARTSSGVLRGTADMYVGMSQVERERNDLRAAMQLLAKSQELGEHYGLPQNRYRSCVAMARIREARGDLDGALGMLNEAEVTFNSDFSPNVRPIAAMKVRIWIRQGRLAEAAAWAKEHGLTARDDLRYMREFEHLTLVRLLLAQSEARRDDGVLGEASDLSARLLEAAEACGRAGSIIECLMLRALVHEAKGDTSTAVALLERALEMAAPEGYVRLFLDEGAVMLALLQKATERDGSAYARQLLGGASDAIETKPARQAKHDALSEREMEVLRLLGTDLSGPEIARELVVSLNTMRTHTKSIYSKLGVSGRREAIRRAGELRLL